MSGPILDTLNDIVVSTEKTDEFTFRFVIGSGQSKRTLYARNADEARQACGIDVQAQRRESMAQAKPTSSQHNYLIHLGVSQENTEYLINNFSRLDIHDAIAEIVNAQKELADEMTAGLIAQDGAGKILHSSDDGGASVGEEFEARNRAHTSVDNRIPCGKVTKAGTSCRNAADACPHHS